MRRLPLWKWVLIGLAGTIIFVTAVALTVGTPSTKLTGKVAGSIGHSTVGVHLADSDAYDHLNYGDAWCAWRGDHVVVGASFFNTWSADVVVSVLPAYSLTDGGMHGDSEDLAVHVAAGESFEWTGDAGHPDGGHAGTRIASCSPMVESVEAG